MSGRVLLLNLPLLLPILLIPLPKQPLILPLPLLSLLAIQSPRDLLDTSLLLLAVSCFKCQVWGSRFSGALSPALPPLTQRRQPFLHAIYSDSLDNHGHAQGLVMLFAVDVVEVRLRILELHLARLAVEDGGDGGGSFEGGGVGEHGGVGFTILCRILVLPQPHLPPYSRLAKLPPPHLQLLLPVLIGAE